MTFSIVIPLYNKCNSISNTLQSVLEQTHRDFELIIIDDGSTDGSAEVVAHFHDDRIRLLRQTNAGVSAARNRGMEEARNECIAFLDGDDFWEPVFLAEMAELVQSFPQAAMYGCAYDKKDKGHTTSVDFFLPDGYRGVVHDYFEHARKNHLFCSSAVVLKKNAVEKAGFFDGRISIGEDLDYWFRVACHYPVAFCNKVLAHYNTGAENRAMANPQPFEKNILAHMAKYKPLEREHAAFACYINWFRIKKLYELFFTCNPGKEAVDQYFSLIDASAQGTKHKILMQLPHWIQKLIIGLKSKFDLQRPHIRY